MKKTNFLFALLAIVLATGSAFTPAKKKAVDEKKWFQLVNSGYPELASSYELTTPLIGDEGDDVGCPYSHSSTVCAIRATPELDINNVARPNSTDLSSIVTGSDHFQYAITEENILQFVEE